uniref:Uncharacterized protein n=1 Tax=Romanomermis culicivorax TaxID=13658 RepID=A0A915IAJ9_ROMCU
MNKFILKKKKLMSKIRNRKKVQTRGRQILAGTKSSNDDMNANKTGKFDIIKDTSKAVVDDATTAHPTRNVVSADKKTGKPA